MSRVNEKSQEYENIEQTFLYTFPPYKFSPRLTILEKKIKIKMIFFQLNKFLLLFFEISQKR